MVIFYFRFTSNNECHWTYQEKKITTISKSQLVCDMTTLFVVVLDGDFSSLLNNPKNLDLSFKTDLAFWSCFG